jgi:hypothetical protein
MILKLVISIFKFQISTLFAHQPVPPHSLGLKESPGQVPLWLNGLVQQLLLHNI